MAVSQAESCRALLLQHERALRLLLEWTRHGYFRAAYAIGLLAMTGTCFCFCLFVVFHRFALTVLTASGRDILIPMGAVAAAVVALRRAESTCMTANSHAQPSRIWQDPAAASRFVRIAVVNRIPLSFSSVVGAVDVVCLL